MGDKSARVLIVEDEFFVGLMLQEDLGAAGFETLGPYGDLASATRAAGGETFDFALLDVNLRGEFVYPLAEALAGRGVPFILLSGYGALDLPEALRSARRLSKPYDHETLIRELQRMVDSKR